MRRASKAMRPHPGPAVSARYGSDRLRIGPFDSQQGYVVAGNREHLAVPTVVSIWKVRQPEPGGGGSANIGLAPSGAAGVVV